MKSEPETFKSKLATSRKAPNFKSQLADEVGRSQRSGQLAAAWPLNPVVTASGRSHCTQCLEPSRATAQGPLKRERCAQHWSRLGLLWPTAQNRRPVRLSSSTTSTPCVAFSDRVRSVQSNTSLSVAVAASRSAAHRSYTESNSERRALWPTALRGRCDAVGDATLRTLREEHVDVCAPVRERVRADGVAERAQVHQLHPTDPAPRHSVLACTAVACNESTACTAPAARSWCGAHWCAQTVQQQRTYRDRSSALSTDR